MFLKTLDEVETLNEEFIVALLRVIDAQDERIKKLEEKIDRIDNDEHNYIKGYQ
jgi:hypothetical protein